VNEQISQCLWENNPKADAWDIPKTLTRAPRCSLMKPAGGYARLFIQIKKVGEIAFILPIFYE